MTASLICILIDLGVMAFLMILGVLFIHSNGKACDFLAGYNMASTEERKNYDEVKLCNYTGKTFIVWGGFFIVGAVIDIFFPGVGVSFAFVMMILALVYYSYFIRYKRFDEMFKIKNAGIKPETEEKEK